MSLSVVDGLMIVSEAANGAMVDVVSGYRSADSQDALRVAGNPRAARVSQHTYGVAADFYIVGMSTAEAAMITFRTGAFPRVNLYQGSGGAVHVDMLRTRPGISYFVDWRQEECCRK